MNDLFAKLLELKRRNRSVHFWIAPDEDGKSWEAGWYSREPGTDNYCEGKCSPDDAVEWVAKHWEDKPDA